METDTTTRLESIWPGLEAGVPKPLMPYSPAVRAGDWVFVSGQLASDFETGLAPEVRSANTLLADELYLQSRFVLKNLMNTMTAAGCDPKRDMVRIWHWFASDRPTVAEFDQGETWAGIGIKPYLDAAAELLGPPAAPASSLGIRELLCLGTRVEVDMICRSDGNATELLHAGDDDPEAASGHVAGLRRGDWVFLAAQGAENAEAGAAAVDSWEDSAVESQTDRILDRLSQLAEAAGSSLERAVRADVYIGSPRDFAAMDRAWRRRLPDRPPARVVVPYMGMGHRGSRIEIALTLLAADSPLTVRTVEAPDASPGLGHEPQAVRAGDLLFFSTQMAVDNEGRLAEGMIRKPEFPWYGSPGKAQMHHMMKNIAEICEAGGTSVDNIARRVCFHSDFACFAESIEAWSGYFPNCKPASTTLRIADPLVVPGANTLLDLIAYAPD